MSAANSRRVRGLSPRIETPHPARTSSVPPSPTRGEGKKGSVLPQTALRVLHPISRHHRATDLAKAMRILKVQRIRKHFFTSALD